MRIAPRRFPARTRTREVSRPDSRQPRRLKLPLACCSLHRRAGRRTSDTRTCTSGSWAPADARVSASFPLAIPITRACANVRSWAQSTRAADTGSCNLRDSTASGTYFVRQGAMSAAHAQYRLWRRAGRGRRRAIALAPVGVLRRLAAGARDAGARGDYETAVLGTIRGRHDRVEVHTDPIVAVDIALLGKIVGAHVELRARACTRASVAPNSAAEGAQRSSPCCLPARRASSWSASSRTASGYCSAHSVHSAHEQPLAGDGQPARVGDHSVAVVYEGRGRVEREVLH